MEQNSDQWLEWRRQGIGASDAPIILGVSPWKTPFQLWEDKMGMTKSQGNWATQRGHDLEPKARANFELEMDMDFPPHLAEHAQYPFLRASLDGYNKEEEAILEIKCPGKDDHATAVAGGIPEKYWPQLQHQFLVTGAKVGYYYSFDGETGATVEVKPDEEYIKKVLLPPLVTFYDHMTTKTPPPLSDKDQVKITDKTLLSLAEKYAILDENVKSLKKEMEEIKTVLCDKIDAPKAKVGRLSLTRTVRAGSVDYKKVPELDGVDVEKYRKEPTATITIKVGKK